MKKLISILLCVAMLFTMMPGLAMADVNVEPQVGDCRIEIDMPSNGHAWIPGYTGTIITDMQQYVQNPENANDRWWDSVNGYSINVAATYEDNGQQVMMDTSEFVNIDGENIVITIPEDFKIGRQIRLVVTATYGQATAVEETFIDVLTTMYTIDAPSFPTKPGIGDVVNFTGITATKHTFNANAGEGEEKIQEEKVANPAFEMEYNWNGRTEWAVNGDAVNGLYNLRRLSRSTLGVDIRLVDENNIYAADYYNFDWLDLSVEWQGGQSGPLRAFSNQTTVDFNLIKSTDLIASPACEIDFVVGKFVNDNFVQITVEQGSPALFAEKTDSSGVVTGITLNVTELKKYIQPDGNGDAWFGIETYVRDISNNSNNTVRRLKDGFIAEGYEKTIYNIENSWTMLPGNGRGIGKWDVARFEARNEIYPDGHKTNLEVISIESDNPAVVTVTSNGNNWNVQAAGIGNANLKITHKNPDGTTPAEPQKTIIVNVVSDMWRCNVNPTSKGQELFPGETRTFKAFAEYCIAAPDGNGNYRDENARYAVEWELVNTEQESLVTTTSSAADNTFTITVDSDTPADTTIPVKYKVFALNASGEKESQYPACEGQFNIYVTNSYYVFDVTGLNENLKMDETMTVECQVTHYLRDAEGNQTATPVNATFNCFGYGDRLNVGSDSTSTKTTYTITRNNGYGTDLYFEAFFMVGDREERWETGAWINELDMGGNNGSGRQIYWVNIHDNNPPEDVEDWNNWFDEKIGTEITLKFAVNHNDELTYLDDIEVNEDYRDIVSLTKVDDKSFKLEFNAPGEFLLQAWIDGTCYEMWGQCYRGASEDQYFYAYTKKEYDDGSYEYVRMENVESYNGSPFPEFYTNHNKEGDPDEFYILWPTDEPDAPRPDLHLFTIDGMEDPIVEDLGSGNTGITWTEADNYSDNGKTYLVWKLTVGKDFDMARVGIEIPSMPQMRDYACFLWVLGDDYHPAENEGNLYYDGIFAVADLPAVKDGYPTWDEDEEIEYMLRPDGEWMISEINMNMSLPANHDNNSFYIVKRAGIDTWMEATQLHAFHFGGTALGFGGGGKFEKVLPEDTFSFSDPIPVKIGNEDYEAIEVRLNEYIGHSNLFIAMGNEDDEDEGMRVKISFGMDIYLQGEIKDIEGRIRDSHNILNEVLGFNPVTDDFEFEDCGNGVIKTYFDKACAVFNERGQGMICGLDIDLKPGYVVTEISEKVFKQETTETDDCGFLVNNIYYYDVYNGKTKLDTEELLDTVGWGSRISSMEYDVQKAACFAQHTVASSGFGDIVGYENVNEFKDFLNGDNLLGKTLKAKKVDAYTDYTFYFNEENLNEQCAIVLTIARPEDFRGSKLDVHGKNNVKVKKLDNVDFSTADNNKVKNNIEQLEGDNLEIKAVYDIEVTDHEAGDGVVIVTISESELDGGNIEDYKVVYFDDNGVPMEMQASYVEGQGIVFTTGHFSTYAVIGEKTEDPGAGDNPGDSGNQGGAIGGYVPSVPSTPTTPKDEVTNQSGTTTTAPTTSADLSQSTTSKGGETATTVDQTVADKIVENAVANKSEEVVINATAKNDAASQSTKAATVELPTETIAQIAEKTEADVTIKTDVAEIKMDTQALAAVADQAEGKSVSVVAEKVKADAKEVRVELKVVCSEGNVISDFKGGNISVTVEAPKGNKNVVCVYIDEQGHWHTVPGTLNADGTYTFTTGHFSTYAIVDADHAEATIAAQKAAIEDIKFKLSSKQVKTKKGKKAIKLTWSDADVVFDGVEFQRSLKKNSGYGKKPFYTTKEGATSYTNTSVKKGTKYYYRARGFVVIDGEKVYTKWSTKAYRTVK